VNRIDVEHCSPVFPNCWIGAGLVRLAQSNCTAITGLIYQISEVLIPRAEEEAAISLSVSFIANHGKAALERRFECRAVIALQG